MDKDGSGRKDSCKCAQKARINTKNSNRVYPGFLFWYGRDHIMFEKKAKYDIIPIDTWEFLMKEIIALIMLAVYTILEFVSYIPQIVKILKTKHADDLSLTSWFVWMTTDISYLVYILLESPQIGVIFIGLLNLFFTMTVFLLTRYYQKHNRRRKSCR